MSKIRSFEELSEKIDEDFSWRWQEIRIVSMLLPKNDKILQKAIIRMLVPILYAHWEGFVKKTSMYFLEFVSRQKLLHKNLIPELITISIKKKLKSDTNNLQKTINLVKTIFDEYEHRANVPYDENIIQTKSNLNYERFFDILNILGLNNEKFILYEDFINSLVENRNIIAHGNYLYIDKKSYKDLQNDLHTLMKLFKNEIENFAILKHYLNKNQMQNL